jgi:hypothetical protein
MKAKIFLLMTFAFFITTFISAYGQDVQLESENFSESNLETNKLAKSLSKGRAVENGIFFTKSFYERKDLTKAVLLEDVKKQLSKTFEVEIEQGGNYFFAAHILPANNIAKINTEKTVDKITEDKIDILEVKVYLNELFIGTLNQTKLDWELAPLNTAKTISLQAGKNTIRFESAAPYYPMVDAVRITQSAKDLIIENKGYDAFVAQLKSGSSSRTLSAKKEPQEEIDLEGNKLAEGQGDVSPLLRSAQYPGNYDWQVYPKTFSCPSCAYNHKMNVPITFTYYRKLSLSKGNYTFNTAPISGDTYYSVDPVMYLYKINDPHNYSWCNDDDSGYGFQSRISASNIPAGEYYLVIRAYSSSYASNSLGRQGLVNVYQNGTLLNSNAPVSGYMFDISHSNKGTLNYFTAYSTGIPVIWLIQNATPTNNTRMKFHGDTFWYVNPSDYYWFDDARMRLSKYSNETYSMLVSAEGSMGFYFGNCDAYGSALQGTKSTYITSGRDVFPALKDADIIISAPATNIYNCTAWAGGITNGWFWGKLYECRTCSGIIGLNYGDPYVWNTWDGYFANSPYLRYSGATNYTRDQANASNGEIAMWSTNGAISGVTHASVRMVANNHPHGYDWESKPGEYARIFHPKDALNNPSFYGSIFAYYRDASKASYPYYSYSASAKQNDSERSNLVTMRSTKNYPDKPIFTMEESIEKGLTVIEDVKLDDDQVSLVRSKSAKLRSNSILQTLYDRWVKKIHSPELSHVSNPYIFIETEESDQLINYAKNNMEEIITFFANIVFANEEASFEKFIAEYLFCEISKDKYAFVIEDIKKEWADNSYDGEGRYKAPMPETFTKKYIKKLLDIVVLNKAEVSPMVTQVSKINSHSLANLSPNPVDDYANVNLNLTDNATVTVKIYVQSSLVETILNNKILEAGAHSFSLNASNLDKGVYICLIEIDGVSYSRKFLKR